MPSKANKRRTREAGRGQDDEPLGPEKAARENTYPRDPATPFRRFYAWLLDVTVIVMLIMVLGQATRGALFSRSAAPQDIFLLLGYFIIPTGIWGRTLGKWVAGLVVVDEHGRTPGVAAAIPREVAWKVVSYCAFGLGLLWIFRDREKRALHDRLAGTWVVNVPDSESPIFNRLFGVKRDKPD